MADTLSLATLDRFVGRQLGVSQWRCLDQQRIDEFADCTGDRQWIHVDPARAARESPFGGTVAHGYLTLSTVGPAHLEVWIEPARIATAPHYGLDRSASCRLCRRATAYAPELSSCPWSGTAAVRTRLHGEYRRDRRSVQGRDHRHDAYDDHAVTMQSQRVLRKRQAGPVTSNAPRQAVTLSAT
ncbi:MAG TPA: MaoC/PaaZ C-terminal domain-containing protein [Casimicrobiaceae bacterium]|nr:MaoC/PaaZ C-terminal domain-containing protein [Casimicrobiaceae bacterium]